LSGVSGISFTRTHSVSNAGIETAPAKVYACAGDLPIVSPPVSPPPPAAEKTVVATIVNSDGSFHEITKEELGEHDSEVARYMALAGIVRRNMKDENATLQIFDPVLEIIFKIDQCANLPQKTPPYEQIRDIEHYIDKLPDKKLKAKMLLLLINSLSKASKTDPRLMELHLNKVLEADPGNFPARLRLARFYASNRDFKEAIKEYNALIRLKPGNIPALLELAQCHLGLGNLEQAVKTYARAADQAKNPEELMQALMSLVRLNADLQVLLGEFCWKKNHWVLNLVSNLWNGLILNPLKFIALIVKAITGRRDPGDFREKEVLSAVQSLWNSIGRVISKIKRSPEASALAAKELKAFCGALKEKTGNSPLKPEIADYLNGFIAAIAGKADDIGAYSELRYAVAVESDENKIEKLVGDFLARPRQFKTVLSCAAALFEYHAYLKLLEMQVKKDRPELSEKIKKRMEKVFRQAVRLTEKSLELYRGAKFDSEDLGSCLAVEEAITVYYSEKDPGLLAQVRKMAEGMVEGIKGGEENFEQLWQSAGILYREYLKLEIFIINSKSTHLKERAEWFFSQMMELGRRAYKLAEKNKDSDSLHRMLLVMSRLVYGGMQELKGEAQKQKKVSDALAEIAKSDLEIAVKTENVEVLKDLGGAGVFQAHLALLDILQKREVAPRAASEILFGGSGKLAKIKIVGAKKTGVQNILDHLKMLKVEAGSDFNVFELRDALAAAARNIGTFEIAGWKVKVKDGKVELEIHIKERNNNFWANISGAYGFGADYFKFGADVGLINLFGGGERLGAGGYAYKLSDKWNWGAHLSYSTPYLFKVGRKIVAASFSASKGMSYYYDKKDLSKVFGQDYIQALVRLSVFVGKNLKAGAEVKGGLNIIEEQDIIEAFGQTFNFSKENRYFGNVGVVPFVEYDTRDNAVGATSGTFLRAYVDGGYYDKGGYVKVGGEGRQYFPLFWGTGAVLRASLGYGYNLTYSNQFILGGNNFVRGYPSGLGIGSGFLAFNGEFRAPLITISRDYGMFVQFYLYADFSFTFEDYQTRSPLGYGVGAGVRVYVFGMPVNVFYGIPIGAGGGFGFDIGGWN